MAQVQFSQTTDADFNKGVLNNVLVGSNNVSLQFAASDVGTWLTTTVLPQTLSGHKAATWNNQYVYVVGGWNDVTYSISSLPRYDPKWRNQRMDHTGFHSGCT